MAVTPTGANTPLDDKNCWQCKQCSIENEPSSVRCTLCGLRHYVFRDEDVSNKHMSTSIKKENRELVSSSSDQEDVPYKSSTALARSKPSSVIRE